MVLGATRRLSGADPPFGYRGRRTPEGKHFRVMQRGGRAIRQLQEVAYDWSFRAKDLPVRMFGGTLCIWIE